MRHNWAPKSQIFLGNVSQIQNLQCVRTTSKTDEIIFAQQLYTCSLASFKNTKQYLKFDPFFFFFPSVTSLSILSQKSFCCQNCVSLLITKKAKELTKLGLRNIFLFCADTTVPLLLLRVVQHGNLRVNTVFTATVVGWVIVLVVVAIIFNVCWSVKSLECKNDTIYILYIIYI